MNLANPVSITLPLAVDWLNGALKEYGEVEVLISEGKSESVVDFRCGRIPDGYHIYFIDNTVIVDVFVFDIAGHVRSESLNRRIGYVGFVDEQPFGDIAPLLI